MAPLTCEGWRCFELANHRNNTIYLSGGWGTTGYTNAVVAYELADESTKTIQALNVPRSAHTSCILADKLFVFGGIDSSIAHIGLIEVLDITNLAKGWELIKEPPIPGGLRPLMTAINETELLMVGGMGSLGRQSSCYTYNTSDKSETHVTSKTGEMLFQGCGQASVMSDGSIITLIQFENNELRLVCYDQKTNTMANVSKR